MPAKLVALTQPVITDGVNEGFMGAEQFVAYCARVSNPSNQANHDTAEKLLGYMIRNKHWSPFEMAHAVIEIETTRDIARQILRHRSFSFQEFSQRYAAVQGDAVIRETRLQDSKNRQNSLEGAAPELVEWWGDRQRTAAEYARLVYEEALEQGIAKEVARAVLPEGLTPSRLYMSGTIRSWLHYLELRTGNGTQKEHQAIAYECRDALLPFFHSLIEPMLSSTDDPA